MTDKQFILNLGFEEIINRGGDSDRLSEYKKVIRFCNSNCVGCEYCLYVVIYRLVGNKWGASCYLCKSTVNSSESKIPWIKVTAYQGVAIELMDVMFGCIEAIADMIVAMDFHQISGTDFVDLTNCKKNTMYECHIHEYNRIYTDYENACKCIETL